jgi:DNA-binding XRE family transcriptional regulator
MKLPLTIGKPDGENPLSVLLPRIIHFLGYAPFPSGDSLPQQIKARRLALGLSFKRLGNVVGMDESTLRSWESGRRTPTKKFLEMVKLFLDAERNTIP